MMHVPVYAIISPYRNSQSESPLTGSLIVPRLSHASDCICTRRPATGHIEKWRHTHAYFDLKKLGGEGCMS
jgi:hypothetical protein